MKVRPKKHLGQHFLKDENIAHDIVNALQAKGIDHVVEIGPGTGVLTKYLLNNKPYTLWMVDVDPDSTAFLRKHYPAHAAQVLDADFLTEDLSPYFKGPYAIIGNFPYNISSQIFFHVLEQRDNVPEIVCMLQKEVAERLASPPGNKDYGILSVFLQAWYDITYLFTVEPYVFDPPPKVKSGVIRLVRNDKTDLGCNEAAFMKLVKLGFSQRRKTLRNALKVMGLNEELVTDPIMDKRAEQLSVADFVDLCNRITNSKA